VFLSGYYLAAVFRLAGDKGHTLYLVVCPKS
jgi:hypothetical protein